MSDSIKGLVNSIQCEPYLGSGASDSFAISTKDDRKYKHNLPVFRDMVFRHSDIFSHACIFAKSLLLMQPDQLRTRCVSPTHDFFCAEVAQAAFEISVAGP